MELFQAPYSDVRINVMIKYEQFYVMLRTDHINPQATSSSHHAL